MNRDTSKMTDAEKEAYVKQMRRLYARRLSNNLHAMGAFDVDTKEAEPDELFYDTKSEQG